MKTLAILFSLFFVVSVALAQESDPERLQQAIDSKTFVFVARQASGIRGRSIQLDPGYTLNLSPEKVVANLPFFGRAYSSTPGSTEGGLKFDFTEYSYEVKPPEKRRLGY